MSLTQVGDSVGVNVRWELLQSLELRVGDHVILQPEALQASRLTGQLPVHLHGRLVQDLGEEAGRTGNCRTHRWRSLHIKNQTQCGQDPEQIERVKPTAPLCCGGDGAGLLAAPQGGVGLQVDGVGGGCFQVGHLVVEGGLADSLLQLGAVWF